MLPVPAGAARTLRGALHVLLAAVCQPMLNYWIHAAALHSEGAATGRNAAAACVERPPSGHGALHTGAGSSRFVVLHEMQA